MTSARMPNPARSAIMRAVKSRDTKPEIAVRRLVHGMGFRFRLEGAGLPGKPDLVLPRHKLAVFVHGCFWHGHDCPRGSRVPATNRDYWLAKIARNKARDARVKRSLRALGWRVLVVWECALKDRSRIERRVRRFVEICDLPCGTERMK